MTGHPTTLAVILVNDTELTAQGVHLMPEIRTAICDWLHAHDINPNDVPQDGTITRDVTGYRVLYRRILRDRDGHLIAGSDDQPVIVDAVSQGEGPPLPWPDVVLAQGRGGIRRPTNGLSHRPHTRKTGP